MHLGKIQRKPRPTQHPQERSGIFSCVNGDSTVTQGKDLDDFLSAHCLVIEKFVCIPPQLSPDPELYRLTSNKCLQGES